ncbi:hypothetical protein MSIMFI_05429 [Mycobacterium simulans]|nr:hypothetical protein MSIMFI_05429 [Mycobacterium simulans]
MRQAAGYEASPHIRVALEHDSRAIAQQFRVERPGNIDPYRDHVGIIGRGLAGHRQREQPLLKRAEGHHILDAGGVARLGHGSTAPSISASRPPSEPSSADDNPDMLIA